MSVCQTVTVARWFKGKELALALGINISFSRLGSVLNSYISPPVASATSLGGALFLGFCICCGSYVAGLCIITLNKLADRRDNESGAEKEGDSDAFKCQDLRELSICYWFITLNCIATYMGIFPFNNIANSFFQKMYNFPENTSA